MPEINKKIYVAGKISGECETSEMLDKCKSKFFAYKMPYSNLDTYRNDTVFYLCVDNKWYTNGLFINRNILGKGNWEKYMKNDISVLLTCDEIHMLPDWKDSIGAKIEHQLALDLGIKIVYV